MLLVLVRDLFGGEPLRPSSSRGQQMQHQGVVRIADPEPDSGSGRCKQRPSRSDSRSKIEGEDELVEPTPLIDSNAHR